MKKTKKKSILLFSLVPSFLVGAWTAVANLNSTADLNPNPEIRVEQPILKAEKKSEQEVNKKSDEQLLFDQMTSGQRSLTELDDEWSTWVGNSKGLKLSSLELPDHRLTMMLTEVRNLASNPYRIMYVHAFAKLSEEDAATMYNRELDGLEEKNVDSKIIAAMNIKKAKGADIELSKPYRYNFSLSKSMLKRVYDLRAPRGQSEFTPADSGDFNLIAETVKVLTANEDEVFEDGTYRTELMIGDIKHDVQMTLRETDIDTFTMDIRLQEVGSLIIQKYALIYE